MTRAKRAFTLTELLIVIIITITLFAIAVPSLANESKKLTLAELDNIARNIYISSQSELLSAKTMGTLEAVNNAAIVEEAGRTVPTGRPAEHYTISKTVAQANGILSEELLDSVMEAGEFVIEYHPVTGSVYGVFFANSSFTYGDSLAFNTRNKQDRGRNAPMVGYYGDGTIVSENTTYTMEKPKITIINEEQLYATITTNQPDLIGKYVDMTLSLIDERGVEHIIKTVSSHLESSTYTLYLDSYGTNPAGINSSEQKRVKEWTAGTSIVLGENAKLQVKLSYNTSTAQETSREFNTLFANKNNKSVDIAYGRHLQNLDSSGTTMIPLEKANQVADINFGVGSPWNIDYGTKNFETVTLLPTFREYKGNAKNILNMNMNSDNTCGIFKELKEVSISDLGIINPTLIINASNTNSEIGILAGSAKDDCEIKEVRIYAQDKHSAMGIDFRVESGGVARNVGGFIGKISNEVEIEKCSLSLAKMNVKGGRNTTVGTFIGKLENESEIEECYSAVDKFETNGIGGFFVGEINDASGQSEIENCYTVGNANIIHSSYFTGFTRSQYASSNEVETSYAAVTYYNDLGEVTIPDPSKTDAFVKHCNRDTKNAYLDMKEKGSNGNSLQTTSKAKPTKYEDLGKNYKNPSSLEGTYFEGIKTSKSLSIPYRTLEAEESETYPFKVHERFENSKVPNSHYGSWPKYVAPKEQERNSYGIAYWETYENDPTYGYGVYAVLHDIETGELMSPYDTLKSGENDKVLDWGYGFIMPARLLEGDMEGNEGSSWNVFAGQGTGRRLIDDWGDLYKEDKAKIPKETILKIPNNTSDLKPMNKNSLPIFIHMDIKDRVGGATTIHKRVYYQINPRFGKAIEYILRTDESGNITEVAHAENQTYVGKQLSTWDMFNNIIDGPNTGFEYKQSKMGKAPETAYHIRHPEQRTNKLSETDKHFIDSNYMTIN